MIQDTSQKAFKREVLPTISERHNAVLGALESLGEATNSEIARHLEWSINRVTPRVYELRKLGLVAEKGKRYCKVTGKMAYAWMVNPGQLKII